MSDEDSLLAQLEKVYAAVGDAYGGYSCGQSTRCCRFAVTGREPYLTSLELAYLLQGIRQRGGMLSQKRRALPLLPAVSHDQEGTCPLLDQDSMCSSYAHRPLGCRSFWCNDADDGGRAVRHKQLQSFVHQIKDLARQHQPGGEEGRPLRSALAQALRRNGLAKRGRRRRRHRSS